MRPASDTLSTSVRPDITLQRAAQPMQDPAVGSLPVCHARLLPGMVTDRGITLRGIAAVLLPKATVSLVDLPWRQNADFCKTVRRLCAPGGA